MVLDKAALVAAAQAITQEVEIKELGGKVRLRQPSALDMNAVLKATQADKEGGTASMIEYLAAAIIDDKGERLFQTEEDKTVLASLSFDVLNKIFAAAQPKTEPPDEGAELKNSQATAGGSSS